MIPKIYFLKRYKKELLSRMIDMNLDNIQKDKLLHKQKNVQALLQRLTTKEFTNLIKKMDAW